MYSESCQQAILRKLILCHQPLPGIPPIKILTFIDTLPSASLKSSRSRIFEIIHHPAIFARNLHKHNQIPAFLASYCQHWLYPTNRPAYRRSGASPLKLDSAWHFKFWGKSCLFVKCYENPTPLVKFSIDVMADRAGVLDFCLSGIIDVGIPMSHKFSVFLLPFRFIGILVRSDCLIVGSKRTSRASQKQGKY